MGPFFKIQEQFSECGIDFQINSRPGVDVSASSIDMVKAGVPYARGVGAIGHHGQVVSQWCLG